MLHPIDKIELEIIKIENEISLFKEKIHIKLVIYQSASKAEKPKLLDEIDYYYKRLEESFRDLYDVYNDLFEKQTEIVDDDSDDADNFGL